MLSTVLLAGSPGRASRTPAATHERSGLGPRPVVLAVAYVAAAAVGLGLVQLALLLSGPYIGVPRWLPALYVVGAWIYLAAGVVAWLRRPSNRMGALMVAGAFVWLAAGFANTVTVPALVATGLVLATVPLAIVVHLLHGFPSGRLRGRASLVTVVAAYFTSLVMQAPLYLFGMGPESPWTVLQIDDRPALADAGRWAQWALGLCVMAATAVILERRRRSVPAPRRGLLAPLFVYGIGAVLFVPISGQLAASVIGAGTVDIAVAQIIVLAGVPVAFATAMLRGGFARMTEIDELGVWLGAEPARRPGLRDALADALGDSSLELAFWVPDTSAYVDRDGRPVALPATGSDRAAVEVVLGDRRIGAIIYDATLIADPGLVRAAGSVMRLVLDNERLAAELRASRERVLASRARIVQAADNERRRIARDLHDGLQARLVLLAVRAYSIGADPTASPSVHSEATDLNAALQAAITELRELVQGVMPAALTERGLYAAAQELADRAPIPIELTIDPDGAPLPPPVETTGYFVLSEALANALKHSHAHELIVRLAQTNGALRIEICDDGVGGASPPGGSGMRGMADRVEAIGGRLTIDSPAGRGTSVVAELPCGS
jgi:signal transduction histidine kinase